MIFKIAKAELRNLFYSPVAWFLLIIFFIQCAIFFTNPLYNAANGQDILLENTPWFIDYGPGKSFTGALFSANGLFRNIANNLYLFVPLLTMGLFSRELNNGSIKLLYSSPITTNQIVFGKYLAVAIFNCVLIVIVGVFMLTGVFVIRSAEWGVLLSAILGFYLLVSAYAAIGLFMSTLSSYQLVSAISTFLIVFVLTRIGSLWQQYDFVRDLTWFLSLQDRTDRMTHGLLPTKHVIYFIVIICMFLGFTLIKLNSTRKHKPWFVRAMQYTTVLAIALAIGYVSSRPRFTGYLDATSGDFHTVGPRTQEILKSMDKGPLEVTLYTNVLGTNAAHGLPRTRNAYLGLLWEKYQRFKPDMNFRYVNYYDHDSTIMGNSVYAMFPGKTLKQIAEKAAQAYQLDPDDFVSPGDVRKEVDLRPENLKLVMQLKYNGRTEFLRTFRTPEIWPKEINVNAALKRLMQDTIPRVVFAAGNWERSPFKTGQREYSLLFTGKSENYSLINIGFDVDTIVLDSAAIPENTTTLVLADPKSQLSEKAVAGIKEYIDKGGNMMILGEPGKQHILNPVLQQLGVQLLPGTIVQPTYDEMPHIFYPVYADSALDIAAEIAFLNRKWKLKRKELRPTTPDDPLRMSISGATGLVIAGNGPFKAETLLKAADTAAAWVKMGPVVTDSAAPVFSPRAGDIKGNFPVATMLTRNINGKQQRIIVSSDADWASNLYKGSKPYGQAFFSWLDNNKFPIYDPFKAYQDNLLLITRKGAGILKTLYIWVFPALLLICASILLIRRKRK